LLSAPPEDVNDRSVTFKITVFQKKGNRVSLKSEVFGKTVAKLLKAMKAIRRLYFFKKTDSFRIFRGKGET
jgi:hypothetical protein